MSESVRFSPLASGHYTRTRRRRTIPRKRMGLRYAIPTAEKRMPFRALSGNYLSVVCCTSRKTYEFPSECSAICRDGDAGPTGLLSDDPCFPPLGYQCSGDSGLGFSRARYSPQSVIAVRPSWQPQTAPGRGPSEDDRTGGATIETSAAVQGWTVHVPPFPRPLYCAAVALALSTAEPKTVTGKVAAIADGDTLTVLDEEKVQHKSAFTVSTHPRKDTRLRRRPGRISRPRCLAKLFASKLWTSNVTTVRSGGLTSAPASSISKWFATALLGDMSGTTKLPNLRRRNGKPVMRSVACGPIKIRSRRGNTAASTDGDRSRGLNQRASDRDSGCGGSYCATAPDVASSAVAHVMRFRIGSPTSILSRRRPGISSVFASSPSCCKMVACTSVT
jgi:hypothetical protein